MNMIGLFSGGGGFEYAAKSVIPGIKILEMAEKDKECIRRLKKNFPGVPICEDVLDFDGFKYTDKIDIITGGPPCQDISLANHKGVGVNGKRSGLWSEYRRAIDEIRPKYAVIENVARITGRGFDRILSELATIGYNVEWRCIQAKDFGYHHRRDRLFAVAYPVRFGFLDIFGKYENEVNTESCRKERSARQITIQNIILGYPSEILPQDFIARNGLSRSLDEIKIYGNAIVPQIAMEIFRAIKQIENA